MKKLIIILMLPLFALVSCDLHEEEIVEEDTEKGTEVVVEEEVEEEVEGAEEEVEKKFATLSPDELNKALVEAIKAKNLEDFNEILEAGADPDTVSDGLTVLMLAAQANSLEMVKALLDKGADFLYVRATDGRSVRDFTENADIIKLIDERTPSHF
ncbi:MAG: ankyrin repeat domain-containing protein [Bdellovibrionales bacterium]|nr:ankyrin repeat domain-containing protein [Bdellovibrionales bacterium]